MPASCSRGSLREPATRSPSALRQHARATAARLPRLHIRGYKFSLRQPAEPCSGTFAGTSGHLQQQLNLHAPAIAAAAVFAAPVGSRDSEPCEAGGAGGNGGNSSNYNRTGQRGDGSDGSRSGSGCASSTLSRLLAGLVLLQQLAQAGPAAAAWGSRSRVVAKQEEQRLLPDWELDAFVDRMWDLTGPIMSNMGFSGLLGAASAAALKWVGRSLAAAVGMSLLLVQVLSHYNVVSVNWSVVHHQAQQVLDRTGDGRLDNDDYKRVLKQGMVIMSEGVPSVSGFLVGFVVGMKVF